jgi:endonuclease/exonuclease/phosphatase family metal-dependent hydrolase
MENGHLSYYQAHVRMPFSVRPAQIMLRRIGTIFFLAILLSCAANLPAASSLPTVLPKREVLRVMTYNIHVGVGMDQKLDLERIAEVINRERVDLVGLQEVDRGVRRTQGIDEIVELSKLTAMNYAFAHNLDYQGGQYGVGILSRFPIGTIDHRKFENRRESERRGMLRVEVDVRGHLLNFITTHLDYQHADGRLFETEQLLKSLEGVKGKIIVTGDFNEVPDGDAYKLITAKFQDGWIGSKEKSVGLSYPADKPAKRIDYIFYRSSDRVQAKKAWIVRSQASDHLPVVAELELK